MASATVLPFANLLAIAAIAVLRLSWGQSKRSPMLNVLGWLAMALALVAGWSAAGAWGVSIVSLWAMGAAFIVLAHSGWRSPQARRAASNRRAGMLAEAGEPKRLGGRFLTFAIVVVAGMFASIALAVTARWVALLAGANEANANVIALFAAPLGWTVLVFLLLMTRSRKRQMTLLAAPLASAIAAFLSGGLA